MSFEGYDPELVDRSGRCPTTYRAAAGFPTGGPSFPGAILYHGSDFKTFKDLVEKVRTKLGDMTFSDQLKEYWGLPLDEEIKTAYVTLLMKNRWNGNGEPDLRYDFDAAYIFLRCDSMVIKPEIFEPESIAYGSDNAATWNNAFVGDARNQLKPVRFTSVSYSDNPPEKSPFKYWGRKGYYDPFDGGIDSLWPGCKRRKWLKCVEDKRVLNDGDRVLIKDAARISSRYPNLTKDGIYVARIKEKRCRCFQVDRAGPTRCTATCRSLSLERAEDFPWGAEFDFPTVSVKQGRTNRGKLFSINKKGILGSVFNTTKWQQSFGNLSGIEKPGIGAGWDENTIMTFAIDIDPDKFAEESYCLLPKYGLACTEIPEEEKVPKVCSSVFTNGDVDFGARCKSWKNLKALADRAEFDATVQSFCSVNVWGALHECDCEGRTQRRAYRVMRRDPQAKTEDVCWWDPCKNSDTRWIMAATEDTRPASGCSAICMNYVKIDNVSDTVIGEINQYVTCATGEKPGEVDKEAGEKAGISARDTIDPDGRPSESEIVVAKIEGETEDGDGGDTINLLIIIGILLGAGLLFALVAWLLFRNKKPSVDSKK